MAESSKKLAEDIVHRGESILLEVNKLLKELTPIRRHIWKLNNPVEK
jgi:hypothetical protein